MDSKFNAVVGGIEFTFHSMNTRIVYLFQVYVTYQNRQVRFYMHLDDTNQFLFSMKDACPEPYQQFEKALSDAIKQHYVIL